MELLGIGEFARQSGLTPKALRLYDELGLLVPAEVDPYTGYRRYRPGQLDRARLVARLRLVGMPLARIRQLAEAPPRTAVDLVTSYWRQVEADIAARGALVAELVQDLRKDTTMSPVSTPVLHATGFAGQGTRTEQLDAYGIWRQACALADGFRDPKAQGNAGRSVAAEAIAVIAGLVGADGRDKQSEPLDRTEMTAVFSSVAENLGTDSSSGTTLTVVGVAAGEIVIGHVGDSRALLVRDGVSECLTTDHTIVAGLVAEGRLLPDEARNHPERAILTRVLGAAGADESSAPDLVSVTARPGDRLVLTTKGVHAVLDPSALAELVAVPGHREAAEQIAAAVKTAHAPDNWSVIVADLI